MWRGGDLSISFYGRGCVCIGDDVFVKVSDGDYWYDCARYFDDLRVVLYRSPYLKSSNEYSVKIKTEEIKHTVFSPHNGYLSKLSALWSIMRMVNISAPDSIHFFYFPNTLNVIPFYFAKLRKRRVVSYWGNDWRKVGHLKAVQMKSLKYRLLSVLYGMVQRSIAKQSELAIFAGRRLFMQYKDVAKHALETRPFISFQKQDIFERVDTCQRDEIRLLYVGTFTHRKGVLDLLKAVKLLTIESKTVKLILVGAGQLESEIRKLIEGCNLQGRVELPGYIGEIERLKKFYQRADIFVLPSYMEGFPRVLYEAMSQSLPIVTADVGSIPVLLQDRGNAVFFKPGDIEGLQEAIRCVACDGSLRRAIIRANQEIFWEITNEPPGIQHSMRIIEVCHESKGIIGN